MNERADGMLKICSANGVQAVTFIVLTPQYCGNASESR